MKKAGRGSRTRRQPVRKHYHILRNLSNFFASLAAPAAYKPLPAVGEDGHTMATTAQGRALWQPVVTEFRDRAK